MSIPKELIPVIGNLGVGAIFLWLYLEERKDKKAVHKHKDELNGKVLTAFENNAKTSEKLNGTIKENIKVTKQSHTLTEKVFEELIRSGK